MHKYTDAYMHQTNKLEDVQINIFNNIENQFHSIKILLHKILHMNYFI